MFRFRFLQDLLAGSYTAGALGSLASARRFVGWFHGEAILEKERKGGQVEACRTTGSLTRFFTGSGKAVTLVLSRL